MTRARLLITGLLVALAPRPAFAQLESFVQAVQALSAAASQPDPQRSAAVAEATRRLDGALAEWDRTIKALQTRVDRELAAAPPPRQFQLHVEMAVALAARGRPADALREFDAAAALQPSSSDIQVLRALSLEALGRPEDAKRAFRSAWNLDPANPMKAYSALQRGGLAGGDAERARKTLAGTYEKLLSATSRPDQSPFVALGVLPDTLWRTPIVGDQRTGPGFALLAAQQYTEAVASLERGGRGTTDSPAAHFERAQADEKDNRVLEARREYTAALAGALVGRSTIYVAIGRLAQVAGDLDGAIDAFAQAVVLNPADPTMRQELAKVFAAHGRPDAAFAELVAGLLSDPGNASLHAAVGQLRLDDGHPEEAIPAFRRALELNPDGYEVRYALATALTRAGQADEAAAQLAIFERTRREMQEKRRQGIQQEVDKEEEIRRGLSQPGSRP